MYIYICIYTHTHKKSQMERPIKESDGETDKNKNGGEKSDTTGTIKGSA